VSEDTGPRLLAYGDRAVLVELSDAAAAVGWVDALRAATIKGIADLVPAARTVLVVGDGTVGIGALRRCLSEIEVAPERTLFTTDDAEVVDIGVRYDGPDLDDVAELTGMTRQQVIDTHTGATWRVAFGGFAPGFAYLVGGDDRLRVPRRETARTKVPAGAVGLAGEFSGIYPRESPGGWQLIGSTDKVMWDLERDPPALLRPGGAVRFVDAGASA